MKKLITMILIVLSLLTVTNGCSMFKNRSVLKSVEKVEKTSTSKVKTVAKDSVFTEAKGITVRNSKTLSEKITYERPAATVDNSSIELTGKFRIDTSSTMKGDTLVKLLDTEDSRISLSVYQNRYTKELMAKVTSKNQPSKVVPFSKISIERTYGETNDSIDTTKVLKASRELQKDSTGKESSSQVNESKNKSSKMPWYGYLILGAAVIAAIWVTIKSIKK